MWSRPLCRPWSPSSGRLTCPACAGTATQVSTTACWRSARAGAARRRRAAPPMRFACGVLCAAPQAAWAWPARAITGRRSCAPRSALSCSQRWRIDDIPASPLQGLDLVACTQDDEAVIQPVLPCTFPHGRQWPRLALETMNMAAALPACCSRCARRRACRAWRPARCCTPEPQAATVAGVPPHGRGAARSGASRLPPR